MPASSTLLDPSVATGQPSYGSVSATSQGPVVVLGAGVGSTPGTVSAPDRSVQIMVPPRNGNVDNDNIDNDAVSISTQSSYSTYSSSQELGVASSKRSCNDHNVDDDDDDDDENDNNQSARKLFWIYAALTPILLSILVLFAGLLQLLPANDQEGHLLVHWGKYNLGLIPRKKNHGSILLLLSQRY